MDIVHTTEVIGMDEQATRAIAGKPDSSISRGFEYLKAGKIDGFASAGNSGAMMVGAMFSVKTRRKKRQRWPPDQALPYVIDGNPQVSIS